MFLSDPGAFDPESAAAVALDARPRAADEGSCASHGQGSGGFPGLDDPSLPGAAAAPPAAMPAADDPPERRDVHLGDASPPRG